MVKPKPCASRRSMILVRAWSAGLSGFRCAAGAGAGCSGAGMRVPSPAAFSGVVLRLDFLVFRGAQDAVDGFPAGGRILMAPFLAERLDEHQAAAAFGIVGGVGQDWRVRVVVEHLDYHAARQQAERERDPLDMVNAGVGPRV